MDFRQAGIDTQEYGYDFEQDAVHQPHCSLSKRPPHPIKFVFSAMDGVVYFFKI